LKSSAKNSSTEAYLQTEYTKLLALFSKHCSGRIWPYAQVLLTGAILTRGQRPVTAL
jgi:hypothetical protein